MTIDGGRAGLGNIFGDNTHRWYTIEGDSGSITPTIMKDTLKIEGDGANITTAAVDDTVYIAGGTAGKASWAEFFVISGLFT